jgi:tyrosyl-tRNA synthetase
MLLQAYDFYILHQKWGCTLQVGGSDQWGNITAGIELMRRMNAGQGYGITHPLVTKSDGSKFGKTETGAIWLDANRTSPYQFFQFWIQTPDSDVSQYLRFFSFKSISEIEKLENSVKTQPEKREAQLALAREMVELVHGKEALETALNASEVLFGGDPTHASLAVWKELSQTIPTHSISLERWKSGAVTLIDLLAESQLCPSKGQARKDIAQGGVSLNNIKVTDASAPLIEEHLLQGKFLLLRKGKKNYVLITVE